MVLELDVDLLEKIENLQLSQLVFLNLVLNENQNNNHNIHNLISLVSENDIQDLIDRDLLKKTVTEDDTVYEKTELLSKLVERKRSFFDEFIDIFPKMVVRPDGLNDFLHKNLNKCRKYYTQTVGKSLAKHEHIMNCLKYEINQKTLTGKLGYMKNMWTWLTQNEWETIADEMKFVKGTDVTIEKEDTYGTTFI